MAGAGRIRELVAELDGAERVRIRERAQHVLFRHSVLDDESVVFLDALTDLCAADDPRTRSSALRIAAEVLHSVAMESVAVDQPDAYLFRSWIQRLRPVVMHHLARAGLDDFDAGVLALYWLNTSEGADEPAQGNGVQSRLDSYVQSRERSPVQLAAAVELARLTAGTGLPESVVQVFREFLAEPSLPGDETSDLLGDARTAIRVAMDGSPELLAMFVDSSNAESAVARFQNLGQCVHLMETWRDVPPRVLPQVAVHLWDRSAPVRAAAVGAVYRSGQAAFGYLDEMAALLRDPSGELDGYAPPGLIAMLQAEALATLVACEKADVVQDLRSYLAKPYGTVPVAMIVADARFCADAIVEQIAAWLDLADDPSASVETVRHLSSVLDGLVAWGSRAQPLIPGLAGLLRAGVAESAVIDVLAALGPEVAAVEDLLLVQLRSAQATPARRAAAAAALVRNNLMSAGEAAAVLALMLEQPDSAPAAVNRLAELAWPSELGEQLTSSGVVEQLMIDSGSSAVRASSARVLWKVGVRRPALAQALMREAGPCAVGLRSVEWLADMGDLASPHYAELRRIHEDRRRSHCEHIQERIVAADEKYQAAIAHALSLIPPSSSSSRMTT